MNVIVWNCRGISSKSHEIPPLPKESDVLCISESKLQITSKYKPQFNGFNCVRQDRTTGEGGGLLIFIRKSLQYQRVNVINIPVGVELIGVQIKIGNDLIHLFSIYIPPQQALDRAQFSDFHKDCQIIGML